MNDGLSYSMARFEFEDLSFNEIKDKVRVSFLRMFYFDINKNELEKIGKFTIGKNFIEIDVNQKKANKRFNYLLEDGFNNLKNKLNDKKTVYIHQNSGIPLKINTVVMDTTSDIDILSMAELVKEHPISLRFIELMPFGGVKHQTKIAVPALEERLFKLFSGLVEIHSDTVETARNFHIPNHIGSIGIIEGDSKKFCATCNKVRITSAGLLKNCLYDKGVLDLRTLLRDGSSDIKKGKN